LLTYPASIPLSTGSVTHLTSMITQHRAAIGSRWRRLSAGRQALLVLARLSITHAPLAGSLTPPAFTFVPLPSPIKDL
jgi:hypothetical protein